VKRFAGLAIRHSVLVDAKELTAARDDCGRAHCQGRSTEILTPHDSPGHWIGRAPHFVRV